MKFKNMAVIILGLLTIFSTLPVGAFADASAVNETAPAALNGGWTLDQDNRDAAQSAFEKALESLTGCDYELISYLGSQQVAGTNYAFLCKITPVVPDAESRYGLLYVYEDLNGAVEILRIEDVVLDAAPDALCETEIPGTPNPFTHVSTLEEASEMVGFELTLPDAPENYPNRVIRAMEGMIEVLYLDVTEAGESANEAYRVRKAYGPQDVSGDYNEYAVIQPWPVGERNVTLKGDGDTWSVAVWTEGAYAYALDAQDHPMTTRQITALIEAIH